MTLHKCQVFRDITDLYRCYRPMNRSNLPRLFGLSELYINLLHLYLVGSTTYSVTHRNYVDELPRSATHANRNETWT